LFGRGLIYAVAFWAVYSVLYRPPWFIASTMDKEDKRTESAWKSYDDQQARTEKAWATSEQQQRRMDAILTKQEEVWPRFEKVISSWENQTTTKR
jgi:hypothetical protein